MPPKANAPKRVISLARHDSRKQTKHPTQQAEPRLNAGLCHPNNRQDTASLPRSLLSPQRAGGPSPVALEALPPHGSHPARETGPPAGGYTPAASGVITHADEGTWTGSCGAGCPETPGLPNPLSPSSGRVVRCSTPVGLVGDRVLG